MDEGKILLINLAKGTLGEENSNFLGLLLVPRVLMAAMSRSNVPMEEERDFISMLMSFRILPHRTLPQFFRKPENTDSDLRLPTNLSVRLREEVKNAVFGNVGTIVSFRVGVTDAKLFTA